MGIMEKTECGVGVRSHVLKRYFIRLHLFHFMAHDVEKTESRFKIVAKLNDFRQFIIRLCLFHFIPHKIKKTESDKISP